MAPGPPPSQEKPTRCSALSGIVDAPPADMLARGFASQPRGAAPRTLGDVSPFASLPCRTQRWRRHLPGSDRADRPLAAQPPRRAGGAPNPAAERAVAAGGRHLDAGSRRFELCLLSSYRPLRTVIQSSFSFAIFFFFCFNFFYRGKIGIT